jgi:DNA repair protein RecN (Recombination protein N)
LLLELRVRGLAVIESVDCEFGGGLNVLTGETGSGKSVLLAALGLALGDRGDSQMVRQGTERALVSATFTWPEDQSEQLAALGVAPAEVLVLTREVGPRSPARINGGLVPAAQLRELGERLVERHGQGAASRWLRESDQRSGLDGYAGGRALELRSAVAELERQHRLAAQRLSLARDRNRAEASHLAMARSDLAELEAARLAAGEDERLSEERERLLHLARLREAAEGLRRVVAGTDTDPGAADAIASELQAGRPAFAIDPELDRSRSQAEDALAILRDLGLQLGSYLERLPLDQDRLQEVEERLQLLERVARRHGGSLEEAIRRREAARQLVAAEGTAGLDLRELEAQLEELGERLAACCQELSEIRSRVAAQLAAEVTADLHQMLMPAAELRVQIWQDEDPEGVPGPAGVRYRVFPDGWDRVRVLLAANRGDPLRPLTEAASGGELSRVVLAVLARLSIRAEAHTVVFDEIDEGLGGEAANRVGDLLLQVAGQRQVICVTHLATIAARAGRHLRVRKSESQGRSQSHLEAVEGEARVDELARLLAGEATPKAARNHAAELLAAVGAGMRSSGMRDG